MIAPVIKPSWVLYGVGAGLLALWLMGRKDNNRDGRPDGVSSSIGFTAGRVVPDLVSGVMDGFLDGIADPLGGSYADCERFKREGFKTGIYWACQPKDWPIFQ